MSSASSHPVLTRSTRVPAPTIHLQLGSVVGSRNVRVEKIVDGGLDGRNVKKCRTFKHMLPIASGLLLALTLALACTPTPFLSLSRTATPNATSPIYGTTTLPAPTASLKPTESVDSETQAIQLINQEREKHGLPALVPDGRLIAAAEAHSQDMAVHNFFSHTGPDGSTPGDRLTRQGYHWTFFAENLGCGYPTAAEVVQGWLTSPEHQANLLASEAQAIGVGFVHRPGTDCRDYWTADFAAGE